MANGNSGNFSLILRLAVILSRLSYNITIANKMAEVAQMTVSPVWDVADNGTFPCRVEERNSSTGAVILHGFSHRICSIEVNVSQGHHAIIEIPRTYNATVDNFLLYAERRGNMEHCTNPYIVFTEQDAPCNAILLTETFFINLQGNASVCVNGIAPLDPKPVCPEYIDGIAKVNQTCQRVEGYNNKVTCKLNWESRCTIRFQSDCNASLARRQVAFQCPHNLLHRDQKTLVIYPIETSILDLSDNNIINLGFDSFHGLVHLQTLYLERNDLVTLDVDIFQGLANLRNVSLIWNNLTSLPVGLFAGLTHFNKIVLYGNQIGVLNESTFHGLGQLTYLSLGWNKLTTLPSKLFKGLGSLIELYLYGNQLSTLDCPLFSDLINLHIFYMVESNLISLPDGIFEQLRKLEYLILGSNHLKQLGKTIFHGLVELRVLNLTKNELTKLDHDVFKDTIKLSLIELSENKLKQCPNLEHLTSLDFLNLGNNLLTEIHPDSFSSLSSYSHLYVSQHEICECYVPEGVTCSAANSRSPYLTCYRLLSDRVLVVMMWLIGINALGGNIFVLVWRKKNTKNYKVQDFLLNNLAISDLLMGVYMVVIACADVIYGDNFPMQSESWRSGVACRVAGAISIISSEASVFFVTLISIDRYTSIKYPYSMSKLGKQSAIVTSLLIWTCSITLGVAPSILAGTNVKFYDNSHVCIGLPLSLIKTYTTTKHNTLIILKNTGLHYNKETFTTEYTGLINGSYFSTALFLGLNCLCYLIILVCYIEIIRAIAKSAKESGRTHGMNEQIRITTNVAAIVATDFLCWFPVILLGILVQARAIELPPSVYAWSVTFLLPINSAINPYLYTVSEIISKHRKRKSARGIQQVMTLSRIETYE